MTTVDTDNLLRNHHDEIASRCAELRSSAFADDPRDVILRYRNLERAVLEHMEAEEQTILPAYERLFPEDARAILATHDELRRQLYRLGIDVELHAIRLESIDQLLATLSAHVVQEDRAMYPWAQRCLPASSRREVFERIGRSLRLLQLSQRPHAESAVPPSISE